MVNQTRHSRRRWYSAAGTTVPMTAWSISAGFSPVRCSRVVSQTAYSSDVRCGSVAMRQVPRQFSPSCTAKTTLVLPASTTSSTGPPYPNRTCAADWAAATTGAGNTKNSVVTMAPTPATKLSDGVRASNAGCASSKYIVLTTRR